MLYMDGGKKGDESKRIRDNWFRRSFAEESKWGYDCGIFAGMMKPVLSILQEVLKGLGLAFYLVF